MTTTRLKPHPAADLFPMMTEPELEQLARDINTRGQLEAIVVITTGKEDLILDGRNRYEACRRAGVEPYLLTWEDELSPTASPTAYVLSKNLHRRHLNETQRAVIGVEALELFEVEAKKRQKSGQAASVPPPTLPPIGGKVSEPPGEKKRAPTAAAQAAKDVGASARSVERAKAVLAKKPELREQLKTAKMRLSPAERAIRREAQDKQVLEYRPPAGTYSVIVTDVPWRYDDQLEGDGARSGVQYPTMTVEEIVAMKLGDTKAAADCALWFWTTNAFLIDGTAARVLSEWRFEPKALITWRKVDSKGKDRLGAGRYLRNVTEHCILAVRGKPVIRGEDVPNIFDAPRREHSEKPDEFFAIVDKVCPAPPESKLELFARKDRAGWVTSGAEKPNAGRRRKQLIVVPEDDAA